MNQLSPELIYMAGVTWLFVMIIAPLAIVFLRWLEREPEDAKNAITQESDDTL